MLFRTDQPFEWNMQEGGIFVLNSMTMVRIYINWCHLTNILSGCTQPKKSDQHQTSDIVSPISWNEAVMKLDPTWN